MIRKVSIEWCQIVHFHSKTVIFENFLSIFRDTLVRWVGCKGVTVSCANRDNIENGFVLKQIQKKVLRYKVHFKLSCKPIWRLSEFLMVNFLHNIALHSRICSWKGITCQNVTWWQKLCHEGHRVWDQWNVGNKNIDLWNLENLQKALLTYFHD